MTEEISIDITLCKNCQKVVPQTKGKRKKNFCDRKCYYQFCIKTGHFKRHQMLYLERHPEARAKNRERAKIYFETHKKPRKNPYCKCGKELIGKQIKFCKECAVKNYREYLRLYYQQHKKPRPDLFCLNCGKKLEGIQKKYCNDKCQYKHYWNIPKNNERRKENYKKRYNKKRAKRIKELENQLRRLKRNEIHNTICESGRKL